ASGSGGGRSGSLYDVLELILDRGLVIDAFVRVSLVGIELLTIDVRVVVASVDTYLRFAEACNRLDLTHNSKSETLPEMIGSITEKGAKGKSKGALSGAVETVAESFRDGREEASGKGRDDEEQPRRRSARRKEEAS
ncbi:gas vesicle structural protein GvpA, partial [Actinoalloteichus caeruleus]